MKQNVIINNTYIRGEIIKKKTEQCENDMHMPFQIYTFRKQLCIKKTVFVFVRMTCICLLGLYFPFILKLQVLHMNIEVSAIEKEAQIVWFLAVVLLEVATTC